MHIHVCSAYMLKAFRSIVTRVGKGNPPINYPALPLRATKQIVISIYGECG